MDVAVLAKDVVAFLAPFVPYLVKAGEQVAEESGKRLGAEAWERAKSLWSRLRPKVEAKPAAQEAVQDVATAPNDDDALAALRVQVKKILTADIALAQELASQWYEATRTGVSVNVSGERAVGVGGSVSGSTIVTGDRTIRKEDE